MRYFRYDNAKENQDNALRERYKNLTVNEKRILRKQKTWRTFNEIMVAAVFCLFVTVGICLIELIPEPDWWVWGIFVIIGKLILGLILLIVSGLSVGILTLPLWKKVESFHLPPMKREILSKACDHLRDYYELQEPYILTKCFDATDEKFKNHDVCLFVVHDELRITTDLKRGFLYGERDLGCYALKRDEITLSKRQNENHLAVELRVDNTVFLLGYRAKGFIEKNFIAKGFK